MCSRSNIDAIVFWLFLFTLGKFAYSIFLFLDTLLLRDYFYLE